MREADSTVLNPTEVYLYAKKHISGYNGSKLSIFGCKAVINDLAGSKVATWYSNNGKRNHNIRVIINKALNDGSIVLFEEKNPIHTVVILGIDKKGKYIIATNGKIIRRSQAVEIRRGLHGLVGASNQKKWFSGKAHGAGFVVVKGDI